MPLLIPTQSAPCLLDQTTQVLSFSFLSSLGAPGRSLSNLWPRMRRAGAEITPLRSHPVVHMDCWYSGPQASLLSWGGLGEDRWSGLFKHTGDNGFGYMRGGDEQLDVGAETKLLRKVSRIFQTHQSWWII